MTSGKKIGIILLSLSVLCLLGGTTACQKKAVEEGGAGAGDVAQEPANEFEGMVKIAFGKYLYLSSAQGFDIALQGYDAASLIGKEVKVTGELLPDKPSIFRADSVEVKSEAGLYSTVFTRTEDLALEDFVSTATRETFPVLTISGVNNTDEWEGKGQAKVYGRLESGENESSFIVIQDNGGKEIGRIIVDSFADYARYYLKKLELFDEFWFYLNIKETIERRARTRTRELFHSDVVFAGLF